jgi:signal transduction histidine kinase
MVSSAAISSTPSFDDCSADRSPSERIASSSTDELDSARSREVLELVRRVAARCRSTADDVRADERHRAVDDIERAVGAALLGKSIRFDGEHSDDALSAAFDRIRTEARSEVARRSRQSSVHVVVAIWSALDSVGQALARRPRPTNMLGESELRVVSDVVHDLRSPLSSILLLSEALYDRYHSRGDEVAQRQAGLIHGAALAMHALVTDARDLARGGQTLMDPAPVSFSLSEVIGTISCLVRPLAEEKGLTFGVTVPEHIVSIGHPTALTRVLLNLVTNGLKFTETGFVEVAATVAGDGRTTFTVRDTGVGLPPRIAALLDGEPLRRSVDPASVSGEFGIGLGLLLCARLVHLMQGTIRVLETSCEGTCLAVEVPRAIPAVRETECWPATPRFMMRGQCDDLPRS